MSFKAILLVLCTFFVSACSHTVTEERIENVVRVYYHGGTKYSFAVENPVTKEIAMENFSGRLVCGSSEVKIFQDIPSDQKIWVKASILHNASSCDGKIINLEIHIKTVGDIQGIDHTGMARKI